MLQNQNDFVVLALILESFHGRADWLCPEDTPLPQTSPYVQEFTTTDSNSKLVLLADRLHFAGKDN